MDNVAVTSFKYKEHLKNSMWTKIILGILSIAGLIIAKALWGFMGTQIALIGIITLLVGSIVLNQE